jgi:hypothetical protein
MTSTFSSEEAQDSMHAWRLEQAVDGVPADDAAQLCLGAVGTVLLGFHRVCTRGCCWIARLLGLYTRIRECNSIACLSGAPIMPCDVISVATDFMVVFQ